MKHLITRWTIAFTLVGVLTWAQPKKWTLNDCVAYAYKNNISIQQTELDNELNNADKWVAIGNFLPDLGVSGNYGINTGANINPATNQFQNETFKSFSTNANASINLLNGLKNWYQLQQVKLNSIANQYKLAKMKDDIALAIANNYLQILTYKEQIKVLKNQHFLTTQNITRTESLIEAGSIPAGDIFDLQATAATQQQQIIAAQNNEFITRIALAQLLRLPDYVNFDIADEQYEIPLSTILSENVENIITQAKKNRLEIKIAEQDVKLSEKNVQIARSSYYPNVSGFLGYNARWSGSSTMKFMEQLYTFDGTSIGVQLSIPILNGFSVRSNVQKNKIYQKKSTLALEQAKLDLERNVYQAYNDVLNAQKTYEAAQKTEAARKSAFEYARERHAIGMMNSFDFSQSTSALENAQSEVIRTKFDYIFKIKLLELYFGTPITAIN